MRAAIAETCPDHYNQFLCTRLARNPDADLRDLTQDYCRQMYALQGDDLETVVNVLMEMEMLEGEKAGNWSAALERIRPRVAVPPQQPWAFEHTALKAELMSLDRRIGTGEDWKSREDVAPALPLIRARLEASEKLWRTVYGLGILRHIFVPSFMMPPWHKRYLAFCPANDGLIRLDFHRVSRNA